MWKKVTAAQTGGTGEQIAAAKMSSETLEDFIKDNVSLHSVKSPGYKQVPPALGACGLPALKTEEIPGEAASVCVGQILLYHLATGFPFQTTR